MMSGNPNFAAIACGLTVLLFGISCQEAQMAIGQPLQIEPIGSDTVEVTYKELPQVLLEPLCRLFTALYNGSVVIIKWNVTDNSNVTQKVANCSLILNPTDSPISIVTESITSEPPLSTSADETGSGDPSSIATTGIINTATSQAATNALSAMSTMTGGASNEGTRFSSFTMDSTTVETQTSAQSIAPTTSILATTNPEPSPFEPTLTVTETAEDSSTITTFTTTSPLDVNQTIESTSTASISVVSSAVVTTQTPDSSTSNNPMPQVTTDSATLKPSTALPQVTETETAEESSTITTTTFTTTSLFETTQTIESSSTASISVVSSAVSTSTDATTQTSDSITSSNPMPQVTTDKTTLLPPTAMPQGMTTTQGGRSALSDGAVSGIVLGCLFGLLLIVVAIIAERRYSLLPRLFRSSYNLASRSEFELSVYKPDENGEEQASATEDRTNM